MSIEITKAIIDGDASGFDRAIGRASLGLKTFAGEVDGLSAGLTKTSGLLTGLGAASLLAFGAKVIKDTADFADEMSKAAQRVGTTTEALSGLRYAADLSDVSFEQLQTGMAKLAKTQQDFTQGSANAVRAFQDINVDPRNFTDTSKLLGAIAEQFARMPDGARKTAIAMELFGKSGVQLIPLLNGGSKALAEAADEAERFGLVVSTDLGEASQRFNDNLTRMGKSIKGLEVQLTGPIVTALANYTTAVLEASKTTNLFYASIAGFNVLGVNAENVGKHIEETTHKLAELQKFRAELDPQKNFANKLNDLAFGDVAGLDRSIEETQAELNVLLKLQKGFADSAKSTTDTVENESAAVAAATEQETARVKAALEDQKAALAAVEKAYDQARDKRKADIAEFDQLQKDLAGKQQGTILQYQVEKAVGDAQQLQNLAANAPSDKANKLAQDAIDKAKAAGELLKQFKEQQDALDSPIDTAQAKSVSDRLGTQLKDIVSSAADVQVKVAQDAVVGVKDAIVSTLSQADALKSLTIGFDQDAASKSLENLMDQLRKSIQPIVVPVAVQGDGKSAVLPSGYDTGAIDAKGNHIYREYASGGFVSGPGTSTSDSILARLSNGEFVMKQAAVVKYGLDHLRALNNLQVPRFARGGAVDNIAAPSVSRVPPAPVHNVNITLPGIGTFPVQASADVSESLQKAIRVESLKRGGIA